MDKEISNYYNEEIINYSKDLRFYNEDIWNYLLKKSVRFSKIEVNNNFTLVNKNNLYSLESLRRISSNIILKETDNDELYKIYKKSKISSIYDFLIYLHENHFNFIPLLLDKLTDRKVLKINPFLEGFYLLVNNQNIDNVNIDKFMKGEKESNDINQRILMNLRD
jgi:hypothetical protein